MQQPQTRPLLGDSVSSTTSPTARRSNPVAVLTHQQLQQLQQLQAQNSTGQPLTFTLQQPSNNGQEQGNGSATANHIVYLNQLSQLNQNTINQSGTGMGLPPATPTFGVGLNMGLPLSLLNTSLTSLTSNVITTSNPLLNIGLPNINSGITTVNPGINTLNALNSTLNSNLPSNSISNGLAGLTQDINSINSGVNRLNTSINSGLSNINSGLSSVNSTLTNLNQNFTTLNANVGETNTGISNLGTLNTNQHSTSTSNINQQNFNRSLIQSCNTSFPYQTIQSIQSIAPHIVGSSVAQVPISQHSISSGASMCSNVFTNTSNAPILSTTASTNQSPNVSINQSIHLSTMHANQSQASVANMTHFTTANDPISTLTHVSNMGTHTANFQTQRQFNQTPNSGLGGSINIGSGNQTTNTVKTVQNIQTQNVSSPGSPFSIPLKSPASNIAPPTPSPSPNRLLLRSPASNSIQSNRNSPSPVATSNANSNFNIQLQSPMQSPMSVGPIQSPAPSPYPPAKSPHHLGSGNTLNNRSPAPGGSPGPPVVRSNTPILQQGMQVLQIIGTPQGYQQTSSQLVTRAHLFGNQQIQITTAKPTKQPPQILPKPPHQQGVTPPQKQRVTTTITNQVTQQTQPQLVLASPQQNQTTATMIPTAQGLLLNQVLPSSGPVIVQQQPGGVQLILRTPTNAQQQTHTAQLTQQQLVRVVTAQGMQLPTFFAVPNGFSSPAQPVLRHTPSPAPPNSGNNNSIVIQNAMVQSPQQQMSQVNTSTQNHVTAQQPTVVDQNLLPPPKKKAKKKKKTKKKDDDPPKLDLASIMKISGIGDDDDMFDNEIMPDATDQATQQQQHQQINVEQSTVQQLGQLSPHPQITNTTQNVIQSVATSATNIQTSSTITENYSSQLVAQLQMPVQNTISGHLRLAVGEDGRVVLHHTPEPNQPEIDQATAQALIRSLTQSTGQNSQIISQLLGHTPTFTQHQVQSSQSQSINRSKNPPKIPTSVGHQTFNQIVNATGQSSTANTTPHHVQVCTKMAYTQNASNIAQSGNTTVNVVGQRNVESITASNQQSNINSQTVAQITRSVHQLNAGMQLTNPNIQIAVGPTSPKIGCAKFIEQPTAKTISQQCHIGQQTANTTTMKKTTQQLTLQKTTMAKTTNIRQNIVKSTQQTTAQAATVNRTVHVVKNPRNIHQQQKNQHEQHTIQQSNEQINQQNLHQISTQTLQSMNVQRVLEQNLHKVTVSGVQQHNSLNLLHQNTATNTQQQQQQQQQQPATMHIVQSSNNNVHHHQHQPQTVNILTSGNMQTVEQTIQGVVDAQRTQQETPDTVQQHSGSNINTLNMQQQQQQQQQKITVPSVSCGGNTLQCDPQKPVTSQSNIHQNVLFSHDPSIGSITTTTNESQKHEVQNTEMLNSAATNIINNAPKITPEILNTLSNLNPNDQLLIAHSNGQMQVISQQLLQQLFTGQLNAPRQVINQNQPQKIVIGETDSNSQNLQGVQINTPTSQIIVNSSGGAPTIQNNIQNIVVQAAPSHMPHQIQIQNSGFPNHFIDHLNQQQIRNLTNNQQTTANQSAQQAPSTATATATTTTTPTVAAKKKVVKRTKVSVTVAQNTGGYLQGVKTVTVTRPTMVASTSTAVTTITSTTPTTATTNLKLDSANKGVQSFTPHSTNVNKGDVSTTTTIGNGRIVVTTTSPSVQVSVSSNGQVVQKTPRYIQLPVHKQQTLKSIQAQIQAILGRKTNTPAEQSLLTKLYQEHGKIVASGKVVSAPSITIPTGTETITNTSISSPTIFSISQPLVTCKNQTSTAQTQTQTSNALAATAPIISHQIISQNVKDLASSSSTSSAITNAIVGQSMPSISSINLPSNLIKQQKIYQSHGSQLLNPSASGTPNFPSSSTAGTPSNQNNASSLTQVHTQQYRTQSAQCQTDPPDVKPNIQLLTPVKQELPSPNQTQIQSSAVTVTSPRVSNKAQTIQNPINITMNTVKQLVVSPGNTASTAVNPRQGVKRPATSPICRQVNRGDLMEQQLKIDQNGAINPDVNTPFLSKRDACKRLVRYHCFNEQVLSAKDLAKADEIFEETAKHLLSKFNSMMNKYTYLLLMESMREVRTSELMMIDRTFVAEEQSMLTRLREQEAKTSEEFKKEEKPLFPKVEAESMEDKKPTASLSNISVKQELEDDFSNIETESKLTIKPSSCTSGDYDEWLEIQKELGVYQTTGDTSLTKCKNNTSGASGIGVNAGTIAKLSKQERTRANGECRTGGSGSGGSSVNVQSAANTLKNIFDTDSAMELEKRWCSATDLERDLLEDTDSLDGLALHSQVHCPTSLQDDIDSSNINEHDDITAQVQSAIDSILNLKKRPTNTSTNANAATANATTSQTSDSKDSVLDQAVRSILGS